VDHAGRFCRGFAVCSEQLEEPVRLPRVSCALAWPSASLPTSASPGAPMTGPNSWCVCSGPPWSDVGGHAVAQCPCLLRPHDVPHRPDALHGDPRPMENEQADALVNELLRVVQGGENDLDWNRGPGPGGGP